MSSLPDLGDSLFAGVILIVVGMLMGLIYVGGSAIQEDFRISTSIKDTSYYEVTFSDGKTTKYLKRDAKLRYSQFYLQIDQVGREEVYPWRSVRSVVIQNED